MTKSTNSNRNYLVLVGLIGIMIIIKLFEIIFNPNNIFPGRTASFSIIEIIITLIFGIMGIFLYNKIELPPFWNEKIKRNNIFLLSIGYGVAFAILFTLYDSFAKIGDISVGLPIALLFYIWGAISSEVIFRLFGIGLLTWVGYLFFKKREIVFWTSASILSFIAAAGMLSAFSNPDIPLTKPNNFLFIVLGALVFSSEMFAFKLLKKYGFISNLLFRLGFYSIWHILWPILFY